MITALLTIHPGTINAALTPLDLLWLLPISAVMYFDIQLVNYGIKKGGWRKLSGLILSFIISLGALGWGLWSVFTSFSLTLMFVAVGGGILLLLSLRALTLDKEDFKHE